MRVALIGDVHANLPALEAVLERVSDVGVDAIWNTGDWVGYHAYPEQVVRRLRMEHAVSVLGNYDQKVLKFPRQRERWRVKKQREKFFAFEWAFDNLSEESRSYLGKLPAEVRMEVEGMRVLLTHGSPRSINEHVDPDTPGSRLDELAQNAAADLIMLGHTHTPMDRYADGARFVNPGSVGRADDGDPRAAYAILEFSQRGLDVRLFRIPYDVERALRAIRECGLPRQFEQMAIQGRSLDFVLTQKDCREDGWNSKS